jgi:molybdopterin converting factor small subunit
MAIMARVRLDLPSLLRDLLPEGSIAVEGGTLDEALEDAYRKLPTLRVRLCDESGGFRPHVLCFLNDVNTRWFEGPAPILRDGDTITILQAVSGG